MYLLGLDVLNRYGLAVGLIDRVHDDAVFTAFEHLFALKFDRSLGTIAPVDETAVGMDVNRPGRLTRPDVAWLRQRLSAVCDFRVDPALLSPIHVHLVLVSIDTYIQGSVGIKVEVPRAEFFASVGRD